MSFVTSSGLFGWPTLPNGVALHIWAVTAFGGMSIGDKASIATAEMLAGLAHDLMASEGLRRAAKADLERRRGDYVYVSPLPPNLKQPPGIPDYLLKSGEDEVTSPMRTMQDGWSPRGSISYRAPMSDYPGARHCRILSEV